ncbi:MAG: S41 family peptidase [Bacteroidota bacterium]
MKVLTIILSLFGTLLLHAQPRTYNNLDSLVADIDILEKAMVSMHPGLYRYNTKGEISAHFNQLKTSLTVPMDEGEFLKLLAQTTARIRCGHTYPNPWNMKSSIRTRLFSEATFLPLGFQIIDGHFYIQQPGESGIPVGAEILTINGHDARAVYDSLSTVVKYDGSNNAPIDSSLGLDEFGEGRWEQFDIYFPLFFPLTSNEFRITYRAYGKEETEHVTIKGMTKSARAEKMSVDIAYDERWQYDFTKPDYALLTIPTFAIWKWKDFDHQSWFQDFFNQLKESGHDHLVIDIRGNSGGLDKPRNELISYLIQDTISCSDNSKILLRMTKVLTELSPYADTYNPAILEGFPKDSYTTREDGFHVLNEDQSCTALTPKPHRYEGMVFILGNSSNVSATFTLLDKAQQYGFAEFVGQTSGGNKQGINGGDYIFFYLPYTGMEVDIPLKYYEPRTNRPDSGVEPDVEVSMDQNDIAEGIDPYFEIVDELINH